MSDVVATCLEKLELAEPCRMFWQGKISKRQRRVGRVVANMNLEIEKGKETFEQVPFLLLSVWAIEKREKRKGEGE